MSQFCGSLAALINRSLLTVILYCAAACDAASTMIDTPAIAAQAMVTSLRLRLRYCMTAPSHEADGALRSPRCGRHSADRNEILSAKRSHDNAEGEGAKALRAACRFCDPGMRSACASGMTDFTR